VCLQSDQQERMFMSLSSTEIYLHMNAYHANQLGVLFFIVKVRESGSGESWKLHYLFLYLYYTPAFTYVVYKWYPTLSTGVVVSNILIIVNN